MAWRRVPAVLLLLGLSIKPLAAQPLRTFDLERLDGLSHNTVLSMVQDREGFLWIGTADGLNRYDGYDFVVYHHDPADSASLSHNTVQALLEGADGTLWIGTEQGLNALDRATGRITRHFPGPDYILALNVLALFENPDGTLWIGEDGGLRWYDPKTGHDRFVSNTTIGFYHMSRDPAGVFWLGTTQQALHEGLFRFDPAMPPMTPVPVPALASAIESIHAGGSGTVWVGGGGTPIGTLDPTTLQFTPLADTRLMGEILLEDRRGGVWGEGEGGLWRYDPATETSTRFVLDPTGTNTLIHDVRTLYEDAAGTIWAGTLGGLYRYDARTKPFGRMHHDPDAPNSLSSNIVMALRETHDGALWVGTLGGGLNRIDRQTGSVTRYRHRPDETHSLCHDRVWALHEDRDGTLWIGTDGGLCRFEPRSEMLIAEDLGPVEAPYVNTLAEDADGYLWIGGAQVQRLDLRTGTRRAYPSTFRNIQAIYPAADGVVWIGTEFMGLWRLDPATGAYHGYPFATGGRHGLPGKAVRTLFSDPSGQALWLGSDLGLVRFDLETQTFHSYLQADGLPGSVVFGILPDRAGAMWVSTNQGLARFDPSTETFTVYTAADGTGNTEYNRRAAFRNVQGTLFFGGLDGVTYFAPDALRRNAYIPPLVLTRIQVSNRHTTRTLNPTGRDHLTLSYRDYTFAFDFAALSYTNPQKNRYAYRLDGFDPDWIDVGTRRQARYTNIPPGRYTFRVKGANEDGVWNEEGTTLRLTIIPPVWAQWWFRGMAVVLLGGLLYAAYRYRVGALLREERLRLRIASDLHDEIGSKLSSIALASEMVTTRATLGDRERRQLTEVTRQARRMVDDLRDIVWFVNPRHDQLDDLVVRMRHVAAYVLDGMRHTFQAPAEELDSKLEMERRRHLYLMYREVLTNIARHARASQVNIRLVQHHGTLELTVRDNGVGFDPAAPSEGEGLDNLYTRAEAIGGAVRVESQPGKGTTVYITAKIPGNRDGFLKR